MRTALAGCRAAGDSLGILEGVPGVAKTLTATAITIGYFSGEAPVRLFVLIILTNWLWIPVIAYYDFAIRRRQQPSL